MENSTHIGMNRTGVQMSPLSKGDMTGFAKAHSRDAPPDEGGTETLHQAYIDEADRIGSVPIPATVKGMATTTLAKLKGDKPEVFIDKLGERLAFERTGVRLYEALILKCTALAGMKTRLSEREEEQDLLGTSPESADSAESAAEREAEAEVADEVVDLFTLKRIRDEEEAHFHLVCDAIVSLGADPTAMTPCADVAGVMASGLLQTVTDPRTTVAQSLNAVLTAELSDNAAWELLIDLADDLGHRQMANEFSAALEAERSHLDTVRGWLRLAVMTEAV
jgi:ferritin-like protein